MTSGYLFIGEGRTPGGANWILQIMSRLQASPSATLQSRRATWGDSELSELGYYLSTKLETLRVVHKRVDDTLAQLSEQVSDVKEIECCLRNHGAYTVDSNVCYEVIADIDSFIYESRSAFEIVGKFLKIFFKHIFERELSLNQIEDLLKSKGLDVRWIESLRKTRIYFFHDAAPWIALHVASSDPLKAELVIQRKNITDFKNANDYFHFEKFSEISQGFRDSLGVLHKLILDEISAFEQLESP